MSRAPLSIPKVARALGVAPNTIRSLIERGEIVAFRVGHQFRIPAEEVERIKTTPATRGSRAS